MFARLISRGQLPAEMDKKCKVCGSTATKFLACLKYVVGEPVYAAACDRCYASSVSNFRENSGYSVPDEIEMTVHQLQNQSWLY